MIEPQATTVPSSEIFAAAATALQTKNFSKFQTIVQGLDHANLQTPRMLHLRGLYAFELKQIKRAQKLLSQALAKRPADTDIKHNLAVVLSSSGLFEDAKKLLLEVLKAKPGYAEAYHTLSPIYTFQSQDGLIAQMEEGLKQEGVSGIDRSFFNFALAKAKDDVGDVQGAWQAAVNGNRETRTNYDADVRKRGVTALKKTFKKQNSIELRKGGHPTTAPIFIVGMPRSGTTLLEAIIAEHPQVHGAGELPAISKIAKEMARRVDIKNNLPGHAELLEHVTPEHLYGGALGYLNNARSSTQNWFDRIVDKLPDNSFNLGLIHAMLPRADIVHIMRHPLDVMLSIYFKRFGSISYAFDPANIVTHYQNYTDVMSVWRDQLPQDIIELRYENLVQDRDFAQHILWEKLKLTPHIAHTKLDPNTRIQNTASSWQVRQPIYQSSREKFRKYETQMAPFIDAMGGMDAVQAEVARQEARCCLRNNG